MIYEDVHSSCWLWKNVVFSHIHVWNCTSTKVSCWCAKPCIFYSNRMIKAFIKKLAIKNQPIFEMGPCNLYKKNKKLHNCTFLYSKCWKWVPLTHVRIFSMESHVCLVNNISLPIFPIPGLVFVAHPVYRYYSLVRYSELHTRNY